MVKNDQVVVRVVQKRDVSLVFVGKQQLQDFTVAGQQSGFWVKLGGIAESGAWFKSPDIIRRDCGCAVYS